MTNERQLELIKKASDAGDDAFNVIVNACVKTVEDEDLSNEDAEKVIEFYLIPFSEIAQIIVRAKIYLAINERR